MPLDKVDTTADITGDQPPPSPLNPKAMQGAMKRGVNRTQLGAQANGAPPADRHGAPGKEPPPAEGEAQPAQQTDQSTPLIGGLQAIQGQADQQLHFDPRHFNPFNAEDWLKRAEGGPLGTYYLGRHIWDALYGAFLNGGAITSSILIAEKDAAVTNALRPGHPGGRAGGAFGSAASAQTLQASPQEAGVAATALTMGANPLNLLPFGQVRGAALVATMLTPSIAQAVFGQGNPLTELTWGGGLAMLFGGKLPPAIERNLAESAPNVLKIFDKLSASQRAINANKVSAQNRQTLVDQIMKMPPAQERRVIAQGWQTGMEPLGQEEAKNLSRSLIDKYGNLNRDELMTAMAKAGESEARIAKVWTKLMRMPEDLPYVPPTQGPLRDFTTYLHEMSPEVRAKVEAGHQWTLHLANQAMLGPAGHAIAPEVSHFYSLIGHVNTNNMVVDQFEKGLRDVAGPAVNDPAAHDLINRAWEGDQAVYEKLPPELKYVVDQVNVGFAGLRLAAGESGFSEDFVNNYRPRVLVKDAGGYRPAGGGKALLGANLGKHRALTAVAVPRLSDTQLQIQQAYPTLAAANAAVGRQRDMIVENILWGTPPHEITGVAATEDRAIEAIQAMATSHPEIARARAEEFAQRVAPNFDTNPFNSIAKARGLLRSITSHRAINDLKQSLGKDGKQIAVDIPTNDSRAYADLIKQGYRPVNAAGFHNVLVSDEYAKLLDRATQAVSKGGPGIGKALAEIEGTAVATIMYSPRIHGMNMAARLGMMGMLHPIEVARWFGKGMIQKVGVAQVGHEGYRLEAWNAGVIPPHPGMSGWTDRIGNSLAKLTGDSDLARTPLISDLSNASKGLQDWAHANPGMRVVGSVKNALWGKQDELWSWVSDFGVMAYHIEKAAAMRGALGAKMGEEQAQAYAARRANSWMGHVLPEDTNPTLHAMAKTLTFAPNWWRTWGELLTGYYSRAGWGWTSDTIRYVVQNEIRTALAAVAFQQMTANVLNLIFSGHSIYQNDPGNWGKVEITSPWAIDVLNQIPGLKLGIDAKTGRTAKGQKLTLENPLSRQMTDTEQMMGLLTSSPQWSTQTLQQGFSQFGAARLSPVFDALAAAANLDLYSTIASNSPRAIDPNKSYLAGNPAADGLAALADLTPFSYISNQIQQSMIQGQDPTKEVSGPFGLKIPKFISDVVGNAPQDALRSLFIGMTGVNAPYERSSKTPGVQPTDDQYKSVHEYQTAYQTNMNALSTATLTGQMTPNQWLNSYRTLSTQHADRMQAIFKHAPEYNNGPLGLTNSWESLYDQATVNGIVDPDKLRTLQREWRAGTLASHQIDPQQAASDYQAVQSELRVNDQKYPMLALYHKTLDAYDNWQADWAKINNVDLETLRSELSGYGQLYGDRYASATYLGQHPDITQFEAAKHTDFETGGSHYGQAGLMYTLFFDPTRAERYLGTVGETPQQQAASAEPIEQAVQAEQVPAAP